MNRHSIPLRFDKAGDALKNRLGGVRHVIGRHFKVL